jgi:hypothetical protein
MQTVFKAQVAIAKIMCNRNCALLVLQGADYKNLWTPMDTNKDLYVKINRFW